METTNIQNRRQLKKQLYRPFLQSLFKYFNKYKERSVWEQTTAVAWTCTDNCGHSKPRLASYTATIATAKYTSSIDLAWKERTLSDGINDQQLR